MNRYQGDDIASAAPAAGVRLQEVRADDDAAVQAMARVHRQAFGSKGWSAEDIATMLRVEGTEALLAHAGERPVGMIIHRMLWGDGEILTLGVVPTMRRRGIGSRLLATAMNGMVMQGANRIFLEVAADNAAAIALYESLRFEPLGRRPNYYLEEGGRRVDALMMVRIFGGGCGG